MKRVAYVLKPGELVPPKSIQNAFDALAVRDVLKKALKPGVRADETMKAMDDALRAAGYGHRVQPPQCRRQDRCRARLHPVGNTGHDIGPSLTTWQPLQRTFTMHLQHMFASSISRTRQSLNGRQEAPHPIEDDAILMEHGIQFCIRRTTDC